MTMNDKQPGDPRRPVRMRRSIAALLLALTTLVSACTPGEIEQSIGILEQGFESAGLEGLIGAGAFLAPEVVMRVGYRLGGLGF